MARFKQELPNDIIKQVDKLEKNTEKMLEEMTQAGAKVTMQQVKASAPSGLGQYVKMTRSYKTPSDDGINTKVIISGYMPFKPPRKTFSRGNGGRLGKQYATTKGVPADFIAILYEYGRSTSPFPKKPFFRKSFKKGQIEKAMEQAQKKYIED